MAAIMELLANNCCSLDYELQMNKFNSNLKKILINDSCQRDWAFCMARNEHEQHKLPVVTVVVVVVPGGTLDVFGW